MNHPVNPESATGEPEVRDNAERPDRSPQPRETGSAEPRSDVEREAERADRALQRQAEVEAFPYVAVYLLTSGIHPSTSRIIGIDALTFNDEGEIGEEFHAVINPGEDPGPFHLHGLTPAEVAAGRSFSQVLKNLGRLIDDRTLIVHRGPRTWGFIVSEARRAMNSAARANRSRNRGRGRHRRHRVGHVPRPLAIVDTLATARRQGLLLQDTRLGGLAAAMSLEASSPVASVARAQRLEPEVSREHTELIIDIYLLQRETGVLSIRDPRDLRADQFGLQRSAVRVDAVEAPRPLENPGVYVPGKSLRKGMEVVVAPEIEMDPNEIIAACMREELAYSEKLTRQTSVVVCNQTRDLRGKAMHAERKGIPLMSDVAFMKAVQRVRGVEPEGDLAD
ncbi:DNA polymerase III subunit epsilon [Corynebacterium occultum]|uniref:DNA polymerase III subunit epsilon n=1 Tax=Corynebacterium occultum TaxID=2675219 RepID=A0A6B8W5Q8_9CORY|nr:exonuclease domain-containing protein [Corynebacterium occultum]QGU06246.1 DNA polymerase III subunit epsilon [Corynebacterium occultum]